MSKICENHELRLLNTYFKKEREKYITYKSGDNVIQVDLIIMRKTAGINVADCKAIYGKACLSQHRFMDKNHAVKGEKGRQEFKIFVIKRGKQTSI